MSHIKSALAALVIAGGAWTAPAMAQDSGYGLQGEVQLMSRYVSRGYAYGEDPALALNLEITKGDAFVGIRAAQVDYGPFYEPDTLEFMWYAGMRPTFGRLSLYVSALAEYFYPANGGFVTGELVVAPTYAFSDKVMGGLQLSWITNDDISLQRYAAAWGRYALTAQTGVTSGIGTYFEDNAEEAHWYVALDHHLDANLSLKLQYDDAYLDEDFVTFTATYRF